MKKSIVLFSCSLLIAIIGLFYITQDTKAILANQTLSTNYELCQISDDDLESFSLDSVYFKNLNNNYLYGNYERGKSINYITFTNNTVNYGLWYVIIPKTQFVNSSSSFVNLYINGLGSDYDDQGPAPSISNYENFVYPIFYGSINNNLTTDDLFNGAFNSYSLNSNFLYYNVGINFTDLLVSDSFTYSVKPNLNTCNYFYIGAFIRLYGGMDLSSMGTDISYSLISQLDVDIDIESAYDDGYDLGFQDGFGKALQNVNQNSYDLGREIGFNDGYLAGINANVSGDNWFSLALISLFDIPFVVFGKIWDFEVLGFNFTTLFFSLLSVALFLWILKKFISK